MQPQFTTNVTCLQGHLQERISKCPSQTDFENGVFSPLELFEKIMDEDVVSLTVYESNHYALFLKDVNPSITSEVMKCSLGILLLLGIVEFLVKDTPRIVREILDAN